MSAGHDYAMGNLSEARRAFEQALSNHRQDPNAKTAIIALSRLEKATETRSASQVHAS